MKVFGNKKITKESFIKHLKWHKEQDAFVSGHYGEEFGALSENFKGCAVGCSLNSIAKEIKEEISVSDHRLYETYLGVPEWVARLEDTIFEGLSDKRRKTFPLEFGQALNPGSDLNKVKYPFVIYLMRENLTTLESLSVDKKKYKKVFESIEQTKKAVEQMIEALKSCDKEKIYAAAAAARSAAEAAAWAESSAAWAASAARSAEWAASSATAAATSAAEAAAWAASSASWSASAKGAAEWVAKSTAYEKHANEFLKLIKGCR